VLALPAEFRSTHETAGLPGYPAVDLFAPAGTLAVAGFTGRVTKLSGKARTGLEGRGKAYGFSVYVTNQRTGRGRYATHMRCIAVELGQRIRVGTVLGQVELPPDSMPASSAHVHLGDTGAARR
jgi:murein DD-endopeptidase MepM/ murein hydrolase activator NlpD